VVSSFSSYSGLSVAILFTLPHRPRVRAVIFTKTYSGLLPTERLLVQDSSLSRSPMWLSVNVQLYTERAVCVLYNLFYNTNKLVSLGLVAVAYLDFWHLYLFSPEGLLLFVIPTFVDTSIVRHKQGKVKPFRKHF